MDDLYLQNLDEFINDERKVVSYKWLSLTLEISANLAKQMLFHYVKKHQSSSVDYDLHVTYLVSGTLKDQHTKEELHKVCIVCDSELPTLKSNMAKIFSIHIYSVQRSKLKDLNLIYAANYDKVKEDVFRVSQFAHIKCPPAQKKTPTEIEAAFKATKAIQQSVSSPNVIKPKENEAPSEPGGESKPKEFSAKPPSKSSAIVSMFANQNKKGPSSTKVKPSKATAAASNKKGSKALSAFLTKGSAPKQPEKMSHKPIKEDIKLEVKEEQEDVKPPVKKEIDDESPLPPKTEVKLSGSGKSRQNKSSKRVTVSPKASSNSSKRRRIMALDSSSDESAEEDDHPEDTHEESPLPPPPVASIESDDEIIPGTPQEMPSVMRAGKGRMRKLVDKTFVDDDGFFVTKKEYEMVTDESDNEDPLPPKKQSPSSKENTIPEVRKSPRKHSKKISSPKKSSPKKSSPKKSTTSSKNKKLSTKSKQASITNFFSKK